MDNSISPKPLQALVLNLVDSKDFPWDGSSSGFLHNQCVAVDQIFLLRRPGFGFSNILKTAGAFTAGYTVHNVAFFTV